MKEIERLQQNILDLTDKALSKARHPSSHPRVSYNVGMSDEREQLSKATQALMRAVAEAGEAQIKADRARAEGTMSWQVATAHRDAEKNMHDKADQMQAAYVVASLAGVVTLEG